MSYLSVLRNAFPVQRSSRSKKHVTPKRVVRSMNPETAAKLRILLNDDFSTATSWQDLGNKLLSKGFYLRTLDGDILIHDCHSHVRICSSQFLGYPSSVLEEKLSQTPSVAVS